jgi:hypothetical protein
MRITGKNRMCKGRRNNMVRQPIGMGGKTAFGRNGLIEECM